ncbi:MAG: 16S rRNA (cytosine(1402)-N(4))-methyltransferase RsmH [Candidatus Babeliales bacterium]
MYTKDESHKTVLRDEIVEALVTLPGQCYLDVTFGSGGHTKALLEHDKSCRVIALDWDQRALETFGNPLKEHYGERLTLVWGNFGLLYKYLKKGEADVQGIVADFGTSQMQLKEADGFSFYHDTPLDMRMSSAYYKITAAEVVNTFPTSHLEQLFFTLGEERHTKKLVEALVARRRLKPFKTTRDLAELVEKTLSLGYYHVHPATKIFQALRMFVNRELDNMNSFLSYTHQILSPKGRLACITFHSLEARTVKLFMQDEQKKGTMKLVTSKAMKPTDSECFRNRSSRSAQLRIAEKI